MLYWSYYTFLITFLPNYIPYQWAHCIIVEWNKLSTFLTILSSTCGTDCGDVSMFILFSGGTLGSLFGVSLGYYSRSTVNQVYLRSILYCAPLCDLSCTRSVQFGGIVPSLMNRTVEIHNQTPHEIEVRHDQLLGLEPELLILN